MRIVFLILMAALLFISGCQEEVLVDGGPFTGGSSGVTLSFVEGAPISEFSVVESVPVQVMLKNNGEYDLPAGSAEVALYGLKMTDYGLSAEYSIVEGGLLGIKKDFIEEGSELLVNAGTMKYGGSVSTSSEFDLKAKVCYPYRTEARIEACALSRSIISSGGEEVCDILGDKSSVTRVSSSPIQITSFTESLSGTNEVLFRIDIANSGTGDVYQDTSECSGMATTTLEKDKIHYMFEQSDVVCMSFDGVESNEGYIRLNNGKKTLICRMPVENTGAGYTRELAIYLDFKYVESVSKELIILEA
ncbi:hypothetical protein HON86_00340 [Candidatus Woesearchaeota archaeon]|jgi:hypothetical protein|nr:hypothetical protein [Candidatus Woesearchaeota archaeon]MBT4835055.1 hypothetical protein [Candidatus Woesearchaeota archaeon]MBT6735224.1 hypothetical protein [Candidatus Woesearchaeota archaeon]MBT7169422.1 hypothetical protein [Candidatus Woesearchaeota archaeon]MBT7474965.1 hypothetical protein [Candidatus Woesearchaeota archaeon]